MLFMKEYTIVEAMSGDPFRGAPIADIACFPWDKTGLRPQARVCMVRAAEGFHLQYEALEPELRTLERGLSPNVYRDSAVELFLMPAPETDGRYVNLECNAVGAMYIGVGAGREDNVLLTGEDLFQFQVRTHIGLTPEGYQWTLRMLVPFSFLSRHTAFSGAAAGTRMRGNFYKIADGAASPYYACWNPITCPQPDFHRPECFGTLLCK